MQHFPTAKEYAKALGLKSEDAEAYLSKLKLHAYREAFFGIKPQRIWQEAVVLYLEFKRTLRNISDIQRICRFLDPHLGSIMLNQINGDA